MTDTPTPPAMTPEQRARLIAKLQNQAEDIGIKHGRVEAAACMEAEAAEYLEADGVTIATLTAECDAAQTDLGIIIMSLPHGQNMRINGPVIGVKMLRKKYDAAQAEIARLTAALATAREDDGNPRPIETAPKDGTMLRLLVDYEGVENWMPLTDDNQSWTIGFNTLEDTGDDEWIIAGWNWSQDCFGTGEGKVIGWLPFAAITKGTAT